MPGEGPWGPHGGPRGMGPHGGRLVKQLEKHVEHAIQTLLKPI